MNASARRFAVVLAASIAACGEPTAPAVPVSNEPAYSMSLSGDVRASVDGIPTALRVADGYKEFDPTGQMQSTAVVFVQLAPLDASKPRLSIGLMGAIQPGTYTVRNLGTLAPGARPEFYAAVLQPGSDGTRDYSATAGTVTLTAVGATLHGKFTFHANNVVLMPPNDSGQSHPANPANLDATGTFVVPAPVGTLP